MSTEKELKIDKIRYGTVIDHLPAGTAPTVLKILGIDSNWKSPVAVVMNVPSKRIGKKDIVKLEDRILEKHETDKLGLIAGNATINLIENYNVKAKHHVSAPKSVDSLLKCMNPNCITNKEEPVTTKFGVQSDEPLVLRCAYCNRIMEKDTIRGQL